MTRAQSNIRFWHKADMAIALNDVRFWGKADFGKCLLLTQNGHTNSAN